MENTFKYDSRSALAAPAVLRPIQRGRHRTLDVAFNYRMGAGFAGMVTRTHPVALEPSVLDATNPPTTYGQAVVVNTAANSVRVVLSTDTAITTIYGITVRPYPFQASSSTGAYGAEGFATSASLPVLQAGQVVDILRQGYIMVPCVGSPTKGGEVFLWIGATGGGHTHGCFEAATSGDANTVALSGYPGGAIPATVSFNGPLDTTSGLVELAFNI
jgi:hypothetical protein